VLPSAIAVFTASSTHFSFSVCMQHPYRDIIVTIRLNFV
jgi:hypothetical protein